MTHRIVSRAGLIAAMVAVPLGVSVSAASAEGIGQQVFGTFSGLLGLSGKDNQPPIDYKPRSPLVLPPSNDLPAPRDAGAEQSVAWPNDPDEAARARAEAAANAPMAATAARDGGKQMLSPEELQAGRIPGAGIRRTAAEDKADRIAHDERVNAKLSPVELRQQYVDLSPEPEYGPDGKPIRRRLVEPPSDYRMPASTAEYDPKAKSDLEPLSKNWKNIQN